MADVDGTESFPADPPQFIAYFSTIAPKDATVSFPGGSGGTGTSDKKALDSGLEKP